MTYIRQLLTFYLSLIIILYNKCIEIELLVVFNESFVKQTVEISNTLGPFRLLSQLAGFFNFLQRNISKPNLKITLLYCVSIRYMIGLIRRATFWNFNTFFSLLFLAMSLLNYICYY